MKGFLKQTFDALGQLNATSEGRSLVSELQNLNSANDFTIEAGKNGFVAASCHKVGANLTEVQKVTGITTSSSGSGGKILESFLSGWWIRFDGFNISSFIHSIRA